MSEVLYHCSTLIWQSVNDTDYVEFIKKIPSLAKRGRGDLAASINEEIKQYKI